LSRKEDETGMTESLLSISELRAKWSREESYYEAHEVGTGVEIFVKNLLKSPDVFALKVGLNSTKLENRRNEFLEKKASKGLRQPDITIFISSEIIIPVEVERYRNINAGKAQLLQYQLDLEKKYGILTDGYTWRFYNNNVYTQYTLRTIFDETDLFLEFWREYIKPEKYYLSFFEEQGQLSLLKESEQLPVEQYRHVFFEDITKLIASLKNKLDIEGYLKDLPRKEKVKTAVEITYAYIIQFILYKTLVDNEFDDFPKSYKARLEAMHSHLKESRFKDILGIIDGISAEISANIYRPFSKEQQFIANRLMQLYHEPRNELHDVSPWLDIFIFIKKYNFAEVRNEIFGYIYENYLKALYEDEKKGQYFTDPAVVNFMLEQTGYTPENLRKRVFPKRNSISLIDPACGSGTFLYSAVDSLIRTIRPDSDGRAKEVEELVNKDIFGLDIAEFPLYLAEMNILMRMLPLIINEKYNNAVEKKIKVFKTRDSIAEFMDTALRNTIHDIDVAAQKNNGQGFLFKEKLDLGYASYVRDEDDLKEMKESLENWPHCPRRRFDFVIGNPPYVGYNECSKQGVLIFDLLKKKRVKLNNIYGVNLHSIPSRPKKYRPNPNLYAFFLALGLALLKDNGKLCYILPQTLLTAGDLDVIRYHLARFTCIEKIITFGGKMFIGRGLRQDRPVSTSSLIVVVRRAQPHVTQRVEVVNCKAASAKIESTIQDISTHRNITRKRILQGRLLENVANWNFIKQERVFLDFYEVYTKSCESIAIYYEHALAKHQFKSTFYFDSGYSIDEKKILPEAPGGEYYLYPRLNNTIWTIREFRGFWPNIRKGKSPNLIRLRQANQGYNLLDSPHKIIWSYINPQRFHFTSLPVIWARNQICAVGSSNLPELSYLFAILNSPVVNLILKAFLLSEHEKDYLLSTSAIKQFVRVPKVTATTQPIKDEIIRRVGEVLAFEEITLAHLVDFSRVMMQKFDAVSVKGKNLLLYKHNKETKLKIKNNEALVKTTIADKYRADELDFESSTIRLSELKSVPAIDFQKQAKLKDYIDDLVFALCFGIPLPKLGLSYALAIKRQCQKNKFYRLLKNA
jgi:type I restriction-modification system DNA methylase subunit